MDKFDRIALVTNVLDGAYIAALVEHSKVPPKNIEAKFSDLGPNTQTFLLSLQNQMFELLDVDIKDFSIELDPDLFIFDE